MTPTPFPVKETGARRESVECADVDRMPWSVPAFPCDNSHHRQSPDPRLVTMHHLVKSLTGNILHINRPCAIAIGLAIPVHLPIISSLNQIQSTLLDIVFDAKRPRPNRPRAKCISHFAFDIYQSTLNSLGTVCRYFHPSSGVCHFPPVASGALPNACRDPDWIITIVLDICPRATGVTGCAPSNKKSQGKGNLSNHNDPLLHGCKDHKYCRQAA